MSTRPHAVIIGGGAMGLMTARELHGSGFRVTVVERGRSGRESSWAGGGILSPLYPWRYAREINDLAAWSQARYAELCTALADVTGVDPEWEASGLLVLDSEEVAPAQQWALSRAGGAGDSAAGPELLRVGRETLHDLEPALEPDFAAALWMPQVAQVRNPRLVAALRAAVLGAGITLQENVSVTGFRLLADRLVGVETATGVLECDRCVVAAGAWSAELLRPVGLELPIAPVRGQMILFRTEPGRIRRILLHRDRYLIPRRDGRVLAGSTLEDVGFDKSTTDAARDELLAAAAAMVGGLRSVEIEQQWSGLRPGAPRGMPYIGGHPEIAGLFVCAGHFRNGLVLAPASARLVTDLIAGRTPIVAPEAFAPGRDD